MVYSRTVFDRYLEERYQKQVGWYDKNAIKNKRINDSLQIPVIILAAIVPAFAALEYKFITIALSVLVSAGTGILKFGKYEEHWHNYRTLCETLKKEKHYYDYKIRDYQDDTNPEKLFVERVESLISKENTVWSSIIHKDAKGKN